jgi:uncharacterized protein YecE (DUF72 family)
LAVFRIGTSGWSHREWEGVFYPREGGDKLAYYSKVYNTAEIDSTFYEYPKKAMIQACARIPPDDFVFSAVVPKLITHDKRLDVQDGAGRDFMHFLRDLRPLEDSGKLGPIIFQLPQSFRYEDGLRRLIDFLGSLPAGGKFAVEFRNKSWHRPETWDLLRQCEIANVIADDPLVPAAMVTTTSFTVIRWHGRGKKPWTDYHYSDAEMAEWVPKVRELEGLVKEVYGYYGNRARGFAVENSLGMMERLGLASEAQKDIGGRIVRSIKLRALRNAAPMESKDEAKMEA